MCIPLLRIELQKVPVRFWFCLFSGFWLLPETLQCYTTPESASRPKSLNYSHCVVVILAVRSPPAANSQLWGQMSPRQRLLHFARSPGCHPPLAKRHCPCTFRPCLFRCENGRPASFPSTPVKTAGRGWRRPTFEV